MTVTIDILPCTPDRLGEGPVWDTIEQCLLWVDIIAPRIRRFDPSSGHETSWSMPLPVGSIGLTTESGHLVAALKDGFYAVDLASGVATAMAKPLPGDPVARFNDGKVDRQGRFVSGTLVPQSHSELGRLYQLSSNHGLTCLEAGIHISNALSFSLDGRTMYFGDSPQRRIWAYDYHPDTGAASNKRMLLDTTALQSAPDGACIDCDGCLWVALVEVGRLARVTPDGKVDRIVEVPAEFPTCPAFGGQDLSTLYVTSIGDSGTGRMVGKRSESGRVMAISGLGTCGVPEPRFIGI